MIKEHQYCFANISKMKAQILMIFCMVIKFYLESLSFKFHENPCTNARTRVINARTRDKTHMHAITTCAHVFIHESLDNLKLNLKR